MISICYHRQPSASSASTTCRQSEINCPGAAAATSATASAAEPSSTAASGSSSSVQTSTAEQKDRKRCSQGSSDNNGCQVKRLKQEVKQEVETPAPCDNPTRSPSPQPGPSRPRRPSTISSPVSGPDPSEGPLIDCISSDTEADEQGEDVTIVRIARYKKIVNKNV